MANGDQCIVTCSDGLRNLFFRSNGIYGGGICSTGRVRAERGENRIEIDAREGKTKHVEIGEAIMGEACSPGRAAACGSAAGTHRR